MSLTSLTLNDLSESLRHVGVTTTPIGAGDAGVIIRADGRLEIFSSADPSACDAATISPLQDQQMQTVMALTLMLSQPELVKSLAGLAALALDRLEPGSAPLKPGGLPH